MNSEELLNDLEGRIAFSQKHDKRINIDSVVRKYNLPASKTMVLRNYGINCLRTSEEYDNECEREKKKNKVYLRLKGFKSAIITGTAFGMINYGINQDGNFLDYIAFGTFVTSGFEFLTGIFAKMQELKLYRKIGAKHYEELFEYRIKTIKDLES